MQLAFEWHWEVHGVGGRGDAVVSMSGGSVDGTFWVVGGERQARGWVAGGQSPSGLRKAGWSVAVCNRFAASSMSMWESWAPAFLSL